MVATDTSLYDNEGAVWKLRVAVRITKNASYSELGDEKASCSEI